jgi:outer membrane receptor protein involved in Fe transport
MRQFLLLFLIACANILNGQTTIKGILKEGTSPVIYANVLLLHARDSSMVKFTYSDNDGAFVFDQINPGEYFIKSSFIGMADYSGNSFRADNGEKNLGIIPMTTNSKTISEVTITAKKPMLEVKADKVVLNVAGSVLAAGNDALSLLRKAPGVLVDNNDKISLLGKSGLTIYIDGKPSPLSPTELANMLRNMSSNDIESIEIISNPSAKYEAQGTGGIINIKRKKNHQSGFNGTANLTGRRGNTSAVSSNLNLNWKNNKYSISGVAGYFNSNNYNYTHLYRVQNNLGFDTETNNNNSSKGFNTKVTADYYLNKKSTIGFIAEYNTDDFDMEGKSETKLGNTSLSQTDSLLINNSVFVANSKNTNLNGNYYYDNGHETTFNIDANFGRYTRENNVYTPNKYLSANQETVTSTFEVRSITPTSIDISSIKMDFEKKIGIGKISTGIKSALVTTDNSFNFYNINNTEEILNTRLSNRFKYDEWVNAAYANYQLQIKKIGFNAGIRIENSHTTGDLIANHVQDNKVVKRKYTDVFPSAGFSYAPSQKHNFQLSYGRRINRPNYQDLNPFEFQLDQLTFEKGNAFLNPEYTDNIQLTHSYASRLTTTLSYSHTSNVITRLVDTSGTKGTYITWDNIAYRKIYSLAVSSPLAITKKWNTFTNLNAVHTRNKADFGSGKVINLQVNSINLYHQQSYSLDKGWNAEISGWYNSPSIWEGSFVMQSMLSMGAGVSKKLADGKTKLTLSIDDIFKTNKWKGESTFGGLFVVVNGGWDSRRVRLNVSYNFGTQSKSKARSRSTGLEDEQNRIKKS